MSHSAESPQREPHRAPQEPPIGDPRPRHRDGPDPRSPRRAPLEQPPAHRPGGTPSDDRPRTLRARRRRAARWLARIPRGVRWSGAILLGVLILAALVSAFMDEPLRRITERRMNEQLQGYTVRIGALDFHPLGCSLDLGDLVVRQDAAPNPPVISLPRLSASVQWRELIHARLVADFIFDRPVLKLNLTQARAEAKDEVPVQDKGWQDAVQAIYPLKINRLLIRDGDLTYTDEGASRPMRITRLNFQADNIRNIRSREGQYPSPFHLDGTVLDTATLRADGHADFLAKPNAALRTDFALQGLRLDYLQPALRHFNVTVRKGTLSADGAVESAATKNEVALKTLRIDGADLEYRYATEQPTAEKQVAKQAAKTATDSAEQSGTVVQADRVTIRDSAVAMVNATVDPHYRVFFDVDELSVRDFSNRLRSGETVAALRGKFMGSGATRVDATFRPERRGPDFDVDLSIVDTDLTAMNDILRAYGGFDVARGRFSLYSELKVRGDKVDGYVKPFFVDMDVYDAAQDRDKPLVRQLYESLVGGVATLLENRSREQVATETKVSGTVGDIKTSTWQVVVRLIQNGFFKAILPGLKHQLGRD